MIEDLTKSMNSVIYERARSPFYGTYIISWIAWNWRIFYLTFFVSEKIIPYKLDFIQKYLLNYTHFFVLPFCSTVVILTLLPFLNNGAYWLQIKFKKWRVEQRNEIEKKQLLTIEQSILLREQIKNQEDRFQKITSEKDVEISNLKLELQQLRKNQSEVTALIGADEFRPEFESSSDKIIKEKANKIYGLLLSNSTKLGYFKKYAKNALNQVAMVKEEPMLADFVTEGLFHLSSPTGYGKFYYVLSDVGKEVKELVFAP